MYPPDSRAENPDSCAENPDSRVENPDSRAEKIWFFLVACRLPS